MSQEKIETISINGVQYVKADSISEKASTLDGLPYVIVRTHSAGVFAGYLKSRDGQEATVLNARRLWQWAGAMTLSQLAVDGTSQPGNCKFPCEVPTIYLTQVIEILECSKKSQESIQSVKVWKI